MIAAGIGVATGPYLGGYVFDVTQSYDYMVVICLISTAIAAIFARFLGSIRVSLGKIA